MLLVISPAKALDFESPLPVAKATQPVFLDEAAQLVDILRRCSPADLAGLMHLSDPLASLNAARYEAWHRPFTKKNARPAVFAFDGDVYGGLAARNLDATQLDWAQAHLRILSGLYGALRPLDLIQPYRLEMGTSLANPAGANLYAFWRDRIAQALNAALEGACEGTEPVLVNLASDEYFKSVDRKALSARVVTPVFQDWKGGRYKIISFYAKRARGLMVRHAIEGRATDVDALRAFAVEGYAFAPEVSDADTLVFRRRLD